MGRASKVHSVVASRFALDGGAMHGVVPRVLWERAHPADSQHRIALVARVLVVDDAAAGARTLIDTGLGARWSEKEMARYAIDADLDAKAALASSGIDPDSITHVVLTHLHWDHAGGVLDRDGELAFPRAEIVVSAEALAHARAPSEKDEGSFRPDVISALVSRAKLRIVSDERAMLAPAVRATPSHGHTPGLIVPFVDERADGPPLAFPTDLVPTHTHCKVPWIAAYDVMPATSAREKAELFDELELVGGGLVLYHDPSIDAAWPRRAASGDLEIAWGTTAGPTPS